MWLYIFRGRVKLQLIQITTYTEIVMTYMLKVVLGRFAQHKPSPVLVFGFRFLVFKLVLLL
ncbi:hypothetical protein Z948_3263 [Sulfitobacter donghicola DSW-25 = KCTC 12864 = JCM 14565]|uniref:Uncharacterized protein n=1 Tax=Sulfitobacter donghicola DSW-25 = KCTC 12864 = JCM 14565 TaxID=1300350 RepID=A0A073IE93_9RHOB|nr:hypothetical protein DSW25_04100 [Sulfitobacter donghicola DSW-25 = KCTC 12864 = JCM 14565]KIN69517.1 hypothetical protein Z948_3263 [Sulfitobacter donghicola DSW-25 = KCTC 12864 = JCM 14565]